MITKKIATFAFIFAIVALVIGLSSCERIQTMMPDPETPSMEDEKPPMTTEGITIGVALGLTGANAEPYGIPMQEGLELAREEINMTLPPGMSITFSTVDALSTIEGARLLFSNWWIKAYPLSSELVSQRISNRLFPIAQENEVVAFSPISSASGLSALGDFIFRTGLTVDVLNSNGTMVTHGKLDYKKAALIYDAADTYSTSSNEAFEKTLMELGVEVLIVETFQTGDTDFSGAINQYNGYGA